jgi:acyl-CoA synthetase (AMP-forming)/AMP-acid ligase II
MNRIILSKLVKLHLITPSGIYNLVRSFNGDGISLMALLRFSATYYSDRCALVSDEMRLTYKELHSLAQHLAKMLYQDYGLTAGMSVGVMCRNHITMALLLPALSRLGVRVKLLNTDIAPNLLKEQVERSKIDVLIYDSELKEQRVPVDLPCNMLQSEYLYQKVVGNAQHLNVKLPRIKRGGDISVFTGGTSGKSKEASRKMNVSQFLPPLFALLEQLRLDERDSVLLSLPVYHGFGLATLVMSLLMGKKVCLMRHFDAGEALKTIANEAIEVVPLVPAMLARLWQIDEAPSLMKTVKCIICGGDRLDKKWVDVTSEHLGDVLFNLFGTTEAGFFMIASPQDLSRNEEVTIGRPIRGVKCKVENEDGQGVGSLWVRSGWARIGLKDKWQNTGDLVYRNPDGCYFYRGRSDNMVVCGGENVYPENVEKVINSHTDVLNSIVYPVSDPQFVTVLNAKVELKPDSTFTAETLKETLRPQLSRAEMPHRITITAISLKNSGKIARKSNSTESWSNGELLTP